MKRARTSKVWPGTKLGFAFLAALLALHSPVMSEEPSQRDASAPAQAKGRAAVVIVANVPRIKLDENGRVLSETPGQTTRSTEKDGTQLVNLQ